MVNNITFFSKKVIFQHFMEIKIYIDKNLNIYSILVKWWNFRIINDHGL